MKRTLVNVASMVACYGDKADGLASIYGLRFITLESAILDMSRELSKE